MIEQKIAELVIKVFRQYDYMLEPEEVKDRLAYVKRKAEGVYEPWSAPFCVLLEDELKSYVFRTRLTELTCSAI